MKTDTHHPLSAARGHLIEVGARTAQDLGLGRIFGQILVYLYLSEGERSLDRIGGDLGLSKAAVSITARQLESLGLLRRVWKPGDRRSYYRSADNIATAVQEGLMAFLSQKIRAAASELEAADALLGGAAAAARHDPEVQFVHSRVKRARVLQSRLQKVLTSPLLKIFTKV